MYSKSIVFSHSVHLISFIFAATALWIMGTIIFEGLPQLSLSFLLDEPLKSGRAGGISPIITSSIYVLMITLIASLPLALGTALFTFQIATRFPRIARTIRQSLDVLSATPSIVFGLFGNAFFGQTLGLGYSILSGGLTLAVMILPLVTRTIESSLFLIPESQILGSKALGLSKLTTYRKIYFPIAIPGIVGSVILGIGRAVSETAALIFTSGYVDRFPESLLDSGRTISVHIYDLSMNVIGGDQKAYASALVLLTAVLVINHFTFAIQKQYSRKLGASC